MRRATEAEALPLLKPVERFNTTGSNVELDELFRCGKAFVFCDGDKPVFAYTVEVKNGEVQITAAAGQAAHDLTRLALWVVEQQAHGFDSVSFCTMRQGLIRKAKKYGYEIVEQIKEPGRGFILRKKLK